jgi:hypothetical protein
MKIPEYQNSLVWLVCAIFVVAFTGGLRAEPDKPASKSVTRTRPQVIYHVRPASNYAATLHAQAKTQTNNDLPIDSNMPTSLQISRENANAEAAEARTRQEAAERPRPTPRPKVQKRQQMMRPPMSVKSNGHGSKAHGPKGHKH